MARTLFGLFFILAGIMHFVRPAPYISIMPSYLPAHALLVALSGVAEIIGGIGLLIPATRNLAGIWLILMLLAIFPANIEMLRQALAKDSSTLYLTALWLRLPLQALMIWWAWILRK